MVRVGRDLKDHLVPTPPAMGRDTFHWTRVLKVPSNLALNTSREGAATASLGKLSQCLTTLSKEFLSYIQSKSAFLQFKAITLVLSLHTLVKSPSPANSLYIEWSIHQIHVSLIWRQGCHAKQCQMLCSSPGR